MGGSKPARRLHCLTSIALMPQRAAIDWTFPITVLKVNSTSAKTGVQEDVEGPSASA